MSAGSRTHRDHSSHLTTTLSHTCIATERIGIIASTGLDATFDINCVESEEPNRQTNKMGKRVCVFKSKRDSFSAPSFVQHPTYSIHNRKGCHSKTVLLKS